MDFNENFMTIYPQKAKGVEPESIPWDNPNYIWEEKYDGDRRLLWITKDKNYNTSRNKSVQTGLPTDKTNNTPHIRDLKLPELEGTILDGEFIHPKGFEYVRKIMGALPEKAIKTQEEHGCILYYVYDIIAYKGLFLNNKTLLERKKYLLMAIDIISTTFKAPFIIMVPWFDGDKNYLEEKLSAIIQNGGEGMVAKNINSKYRLSTDKCMTCTKLDWVKVKKQFNGDFIVLGYEEPTKEFEGKTDLDQWPFWEGKIPVTKNYAMGWIGGIKYGEYKNGKLIETGILSSSCFNEKDRAEISANKNKYLGKVMELDAMERIKKTLALRHAVFVRWRKDKEPTDCIYENQKG